MTDPNTWPMGYGNVAVTWKDGRIVDVVEPELRTRRRAGEPSVPTQAGNLAAELRGIARTLDDKYLREAATTVRAAALFIERLESELRTERTACGCRWAMNDQRKESP